MVETATPPTAGYTAPSPETATPPVAGYSAPSPSTATAPAGAWSAPSAESATTPGSSDPMIWPQFLDVTGITGASFTWMNGRYTRSGQENGFPCWKRSATVGETACEATIYAEDSQFHLWQIRDLQGEEGDIQFVESEHKALPWDSEFVPDGGAGGAAVLVPAVFAESADSPV